MLNYSCYGCKDRGYIIWSDCGDDISDRLPDNDICPTCGEHQGEGELEFCDCEIGYELYKRNQKHIREEIKKYFTKK
jgi:hypothetical protein